MHNISVKIVKTRLSVMTYETCRRNAAEVHTVYIREWLRSCCEGQRSVRIRPHVAEIVKAHVQND